MPELRGWSLSDAAHGFTTLPAILSVIVALVAIGVAGAAFLAVLAALTFVLARSFMAFARTHQARFPSTGRRET
jgi:hypothetical protein